MEKILEINGLYKEYEDFKLENISFDMVQGEIVGFIGENGAGKTTTIKSILKTILPTQGSIKIFNKDFDKYEKDIKENLGIVFDDSFLSDMLTAKEFNNVLKNIYRNWDEVYFFRLLNLFQIPLNKRFKKLSSGMKMKMKIAVALSHHPKLLILDEPTSGLDPIIRNEMLDIFKEYVKDGDSSIFFSTHIISDLENIADRIIFIHKGKVIFIKGKNDFSEEESIEKVMLNYVRGDGVKWEV